MRNPIDFYILDMNRQRRGVVVLQQLDNGNIVAASSLCHPDIDEFDPIKGKNRAHGRLKSVKRSPTVCVREGTVVFGNLYDLLLERHPSHDVKFWLHEKSTDVYARLIDRMMRPSEPKPKIDILDWARTRVERAIPQRLSVIDLSSVQVVDGKAIINIYACGISFEEIECLSVQFKTKKISIEVDEDTSVVVSIDLPNPS